MTVLKIDTVLCVCFSKFSTVINAVGQFHLSPHVLHVAAILDLNWHCSTCFLKMFALWFLRHNNLALVWPVAVLHNEAVRLVAVLKMRCKNKQLYACGTCRSLVSYLCVCKYIYTTHYYLFKYCTYSFGYLLIYLFQSPVYSSGTCDITLMVVITWVCGVAERRRWLFSGSVGGVEKETIAVILTVALLVLDNDIL